MEAYGKIRVIKNELTVGVSAIAVIGKGSVGVGYEDGIIRLWQYCGEVLQNIRDYIGDNKKIRFIISFSEEKFISINEEDKIRIWEINTGMCISIFHRRSDYTINSIAILPENLLAVSNYCPPPLRNQKQYFEVWDLDSGVKIHEINVKNSSYHRPGNLFLKNNAEGHLVVFCKLFEVSVWQINRSNYTQISLCHERGQIYSLAVLPTREIVTGDYGLHFYNIPSNMKFYHIKILQNRNLIDAIHPVGGYKLLTVCRKYCNGNTLKLWNYMSNTCKVLGNSHHESEVFDNHVVLEHEGAVLSLGRNKIGIHQFPKNIFYFPKNLAEIRKNARVLSQAHRTQTSLFQNLPTEIAVKIAVLTADNMNADEKKASEYIAQNYFCKPHYC